MASETQISAQQLLTNFNAKKHAVEDETAIEAQRLVNMYRNLSVFKPEFIEEFNKILLSSSKEAQVLLPSIIGGSGVREYLSYLQKAQHISPDEEENMDAQDNNMQIQGFLPDPEYDLMPKTNSLPSTEQKEQDNSSLEGILNAFMESNHHQGIVLENALSQMQEAIKSTQQMPVQEQGHSQEMIADILTKQQEQFQNFALMMQNMVQTQTSLLNQTLSQLTDAVYSLSERNNQPEAFDTKTPEAEQKTIETPVVLNEEVNIDAETKPENSENQNIKSHDEQKSDETYQPVEIDDDMEILTEFDLPQAD